MSAQAFKKHYTIVEFTESLQAAGGFKEGLSPELRVRRSLSDPASKSGQSQASDEQPGSSRPLKEPAELAEPEAELRTSSTGRGVNFWQKDDQLTSHLSNAPSGARDDKVESSASCDRRR